VGELAERVDRLLSGPRPLPLVLAGSPILRTPAAPYDFSLSPDAWTELIAAMRHSMHNAPGVGLAAPQIGVGIRVAVLDDPAKVPPELAIERERFPTAPRVLVNPSYQQVVTNPTDTSVDAASFYEGCLSVPGYQAVVPRARTVRLTCSDEFGRPVDELIHGWAARLVAHETDHLDGILYLDRAFSRSLCTSENLLDLWSDSPMSAIRQSLDF
jgi:peptide deformylase